MKKVDELPPLVSILMNCYNGERYLKEAIDSIYAQSYQNWEIIFIDNCSTDNSSAIANAYDGRLRYFKLNETIPIGEARNWGLQFVKGKYLAFLDIDDSWLPFKLHRQVEILEENPDAVFCYTGNYVINEKSEIIGKRHPKLKSGYIFPSLLKKYEINFQTVILKFDRSYCYFDVNYSFSEDYELLMRIASRYNAVIIPDILVQYRIHSDSETGKKIDRWWVEQKGTLDTILGSNIHLKQKYPKEIQLAYAKVSYYKALYQYYIRQDKKARLEMKSIRFKGREYFLLYLLSLMPFDLWRIIHHWLGKVAYR